MTSTVPGGRIGPLYNILASHATHVVCVNFISEWRDLKLNVDSERLIFFLTFSRQILFTLRVFARNLLKGNRRRNIWGSNFFIFCFDV